jgi:hypothetical protein
VPTSGRGAKRVGLHREDEARARVERTTLHPATIRFGCVAYSATAFVRRQVGNRVQPRNARPSVFRVRLIR